MNVWEGHASQPQEASPPTQPLYFTDVMFGGFQEDLNCAVQRFERLASLEQLYPWSVYNCQQAQQIWTRYINGNAISVFAVSFSALWEQILTKGRHIQYVIIL